MSDALKTLKNKAQTLHRKLHTYGIETPKNRILDLFAYVVGKDRWEEIVTQCNSKAIHYTHYQPNIKKLEAATNISHENAKAILEEIKWPSEYIPCFNTLPLSEEGCFLIAPIFIRSHIFTLRSKREYYTLTRVSLFDDNFNIDRDHILYSGETLNHYDKKVFYSLLDQHPSDISVGRTFFFKLNEMNSRWEHSYSIKNVESSLNRMRDCRIWIPDLNFCGPLIDNYQKLLKKKEYKIALNSELTKFYYDPMYANFMDTGNLFRYRISGKQEPSFSNYKKPKESHLKEYIKESDDLWPTYNDDISAIFAIIAKSAHNQKVEFQRFKDIEFDECNGRFLIYKADWEIQAQQYFIDLYGEDKGDVIFRKALSLFLKLTFFSHLRE